jgi:hypothetical protein
VAAQNPPAGLRTRLIAVGTLVVACVAVWLRQTRPDDGTVGRWFLLVVVLASVAATSHAFDAWPRLTLRKRIGLMLFALFPLVMLAVVEIVMPGALRLVWGS